MPRLREPLDVFSETSIAALSENVTDINDKVKATQDGENLYDFWNSWRDVLKLSDEAGLEPPAFPPRALDLFVEEMPSAIDDLSVKLKQDVVNFFAPDFRIFSETAGFAGLKIPLSDELRLFYREGCQYHMGIAQEQATKGQTRFFKKNLQTATEYARILHVNLPPLSLTGTSPQVQSIYEAFVHALGEDVRPLPLEAETAPSEEV